MNYNAELEKLYTAINVANCKRNELRINKKKIEMYVPVTSLSDWRATWLGSSRSSRSQRSLLHFTRALALFSMVFSSSKSTTQNRKSQSCPQSTRVGDTITRARKPVGDTVRSKRTSCSYALLHAQTFLPLAQR